MCGIVGYVGRSPAAPILSDGLARLEYRGYDSAGLAVLTEKTLRTHKVKGRVRDLTATLPQRFAGKVGIGHTRWATHGGPSDANAHPHTSSNGKVAIVHNGIIDNAAALRAELRSVGIDLSSETDSEVIAHLVAQADTDDFETAVRRTLERIEGTYGLAILHADHPDRIIVARNGSPIILGVGDHEMFVASDASALVRHTQQLVYLEDGETATVKASEFHTFSRDAGRVHRDPVTVELTAEEFDKGNHEHFMYKEILEQPATVARVLSGRLDERFSTVRLGGLNMDARQSREIKRVKILGCGSAYYAGQIGAQFIEETARIPADAEPASEFRYRNPVVEPDTLYVAVSQSGETADTLIAVQELKRKGGRVIGLVNVVGSSIARECGGGIYLHAGPEVAVASTKALTNMAVGFMLLGVHLARVRDLSPAAGRRLLDGLKALPGQIEAILSLEPKIKAAAAELAKSTSCFFIGRVRGYPVAREGAQKLKEISYVHAEAYQTSELKHGPLALICPELTTVAVVPDDELVDRNVTALHEIVARSGPLLVFTHDGVDLGDLPAMVIEIPKSETEFDAILFNIPLQLLAYHTAQILGHDIDKPRNLAKSVTVE
jgi:glucosamine--fructose-6-phosphate aminotransferase (isomerizing)